MRTLQKLPPTVAALCLLARVASAQGGTGTIQGTVRAENGQPVPEVTVVLVGTRLGGLARTDGQFTITGVPAGAHELRALASPMRTRARA